VVITGGECCFGSNVLNAIVDTLVLTLLHHLGTKLFDEFHVVAVNASSWDFMHRCDLLVEQFVRVEVESQGAVITFKTNWESEG